MSNPDAEAARSEAARTAARARWRPSPVVARAVQVITTRSGDLDDTQRAALEAAITTRPEDSDD